MKGPELASGSKCGGLVVILSPEGRILHWSEECAALTGRTLVDAKGLPFRDVFRLPSAGDSQPVEPGQSGVCPLDGGRLLRWTSTALPPTDGLPPAVIVSGWVEDTGPASEHPDLFRRMFEGSPAAMYIADAQTLRIIDANEAAAAFYGYPRAVLKRMRVTDLNVLPEDQVRSIVQGSLGPESSQSRFRHRLASGEIREVESRAAPVRLNGGKAYFAVIQDVTERVRAEAALRESEARLSRSEENLRRALLDAPFPIAIHAEDGEMLLVNRMWTEITGYTAAELPTVRAWCDRAYGDRARAMFGRIRAVYEMNGDRNEGEFAVLTSTGTERLWRFSAAPLGRLPDGRRAAISAAIDLTDRKRLEQQLIQAQKMEAVGQLAGGVAHDFNNLLTVIRGYCYMVLDCLGEESPARSSIEEIEKASERAASLTRQLLAFSRKQVLQPRVINLNTTIEETEKMLRRLIGDDIELVTRLDPELGTARVDPAQIAQVIVNLAVNARDAMPGGGTLTIATANFEQPPEANALGMPPGSYAQVTVTDTGRGMDRDTLARIFEPFFTTKPTGRGTGLGLSTVYGILKQSGGYIAVDSTPGRGSTFRFYLPRAEGQPAAAAHPETAAGFKGSETILLVEDDPAVRALVRQVLGCAGHRVIEAKSPAEALTLSDRHAEPFPLMITDVVMPGMSGRELAKKLEPRRPEMRVLYMSGYTDDEIVRHGVLEGGLDFIQKPFAPHDLAKKVQELLARTRV